MNTNEIIFTEEQLQAINLAVDSIKYNTPLIRIGGYAGTGKTTVIREIKERILDLGKSVAICAYTGKAASVLRSKGLSNASTIHSLIYELEDESKKIWRRKAKVKTDCFIIDEASMVGKEIYDDLVLFGKPIIAVGDPGQLPPISKHDLNLMLEPDFVLREIHRQAKDSGIISLATDIRLKGSKNLSSYSNATILPDKDIDAYEYVDKTDIFICGFNNTRHTLNNIARKVKKSTEVVEEGERLICLSNDRILGVFNGLMGTVTKVIEKRTNSYSLLVLWDGYDAPIETEITTRCFGRPLESTTASYCYGEKVIVDYGYAITCHKSQGSEWDRVVVYNEIAPKLWKQSRWLYTAVTRAAKQLTVGV